MSRLFVIYEFEINLTFTSGSCTIVLMKTILHFDGSCWPNPGGLARFGYHFERGDLIVADHGETGNDPTMSNNVAEFDALARGLFCASLHMEPMDTLLVRGDSQLVVKVMNRQWHASSDKLYYPWFAKAMEAQKECHKTAFPITYEWIPREKNDVCDRLSKAHLRAAVPQDLLDEADEIFSTLLLT